jgi:hypothetical protein
MKRRNKLDLISIETFGCIEGHYQENELSVVVHVCNPSYLGGGGEDCGSRPAWAKKIFHKTPSQQMAGHSDVCLSSQLKRKT